MPARGVDAASAGGQGAMGALSMSLNSENTRQEEVRRSSVRTPKGLGSCGVTRSNAE